MSVRALALCAGLVLVGALLGGCKVNEATGRSQFVGLVSEQQAISMGAEAAPQLAEEHGGAVPDARLQEYVTDIGKRMAAQTEGSNPSLDWEFTLVNSDILNAFALPGGKVFVTRGLASKLTTEAALAHVIGHEIGHVSADHIRERLSWTMAAQTGLGVAGIIAGQSEDELVATGVPILLSMGTQGTLLKFNRDQELEADALGMRYMSRVGYNPEGALELFNVFKQEGGSRSLEILSTHPHPDTRLAQVRRLLAAEYAGERGEMHADRYERVMLSRLQQLAEAEGRPSMLAGVLLDPSGWCMLCAE